MNPKQKPSITFFLSAGPSKVSERQWAALLQRCEECEQWLRASGRARGEEQEWDEALAGRSSEISTHSSCLMSLRAPGKRVLAFLIILTGRWLGDIPIYGNPTSLKNWSKLVVILHLVEFYGQPLKRVTRSLSVGPSGPAVGFGQFILGQSHVVHVISLAYKSESIKATTFSSGGSKL